MRAGRPRGFTILELLLALSLASLAVGVIAGLYGLLGVANRNAGERFDRAAQDSLSYEILQLAFGDLVAATPMLPGQGTDESGSPTVSDLEAMLRGDGPAVLSGGSDAVSAGDVSARAAPNAPVMFDLSWVDAGVGGGEVFVQRLEVVTLGAPAGVRLLSDEELEEPATPEQRELWANPDRVRSVFEFMYDGFEDRWDLVWRPIDPPGYPVPIVEGVQSAQWTVLNRSRVNTVQEARTNEAWVDVTAAFLGEDFPVAVRLEYETLDGGAGDWLFETVVITREY